MGVARGKSAKQHAQTIEREQRAAEAIELGKQGLSMREIAEVFGVSRGTIQNDYKATLQQYQQRRQDLADLVFDDHLYRIDSLIASLEPRCDLLDLDAIAETRRLMVERAKLLNLYPSQAAGDGSTTNNYFVLDFGTGAQRPSDPVVQGTARRLLPDAGENTNANE